MCSTSTGHLPFYRSYGSKEGPYAEIFHKFCKQTALSCIVHVSVKSQWLFSRVAVDPQDVTSFLENHMNSFSFRDMTK